PWRASFPPNDQYIPQCPRRRSPARALCAQHAWKVDFVRLFPIYAAPFLKRVKLLSGRSPGRSPGLWIERRKGELMTENDCEAHLSTLQASPQAPPWLSYPHGDQGRPQGGCAPPVARPQAAVRLSGQGH